MSDSRVSVALCTHNGSRFVREQIRSILRQSRMPDELVISDDESLDDTLQLVEDETAAARSAGLAVTILRNVPALGVTKNFEQAIMTSSGDFIALSDQDDIWHPDRLSRMLALFEADSGLELAFSDAGLIDASGSPLHQTLFGALALSDSDKAAISAGRGFATLMKRNLVTGATVMVRRRLAERAFPFPTEWVHDEWLAVVAAATGRLDYIDDVLIDYRQHESNAIGAPALNFRGQIARMLEPRAARNERLLERSRVLVERIPALVPAAPATVVADAKGKLVHEQVRSALPVNRLRRLAPIAREWRTGRYFRYGRGVADIVRDCVQLH